MCDVVVREGELADGEWIHLIESILVLRLGAQIIDFYHFTVVIFQILDYVCRSVSV